MTNTKRRTDKEALLDLTELLIKHLQQDQESEENTRNDAEASPAEYQQAALPLAHAEADKGNEEESAPPAPQAVESAPAPWEAYLDEDPTKKTPTSLIMSTTLRATL